MKKYTLLWVAIFVLIISSKSSGFFSWPGGGGRPRPTVTIIDGPFDFESGGTTWDATYDAGDGEDDGLEDSSDQAHGESQSSKLWVDGDGTGDRVYGQPVFAAQGEVHIRFQFYFSSLTMGSDHAFDMVRGTGTPDNFIWHVNLQESGGDKQVRVSMGTDNGSWVTISTGQWYQVDFYWKRETGDGNNDGIGKAWIDGTQYLDLSGKGGTYWDFEAEVTGGDMGWAIGVDAGTSGTLYIDDVIIWDSEQPAE